MMNIQQSLIRCLALALVVMLGGCLPDDESVKERKLAQFASTQAASYAASLSSFSVESQNRFAALLAEGTPAQGIVNKSSDESMATGYCILPGGATNHMLVTWYATADSSRNFSIKGLGTGTGASIVHELSRRAPPETIGYFDDGQIKLRGIRASGGNTISLPCNFSIPEGAPLLIAENIMPSATASVEGETYEYQTLACPDANDIGMLTQRRSITTNRDGTVMRGAWMEYDTTCNGQVSVRNIEVSAASTNNLIGALSGSSGRLRDALGGLQDVNCREVLTRASQENEDGTSEDIDQAIADSCNTDGVGITHYSGPDQANVTDVIEGTESVTVQCGGEPAGSRGFSVVYGGRSLPGTNQFSSWSGEAVYVRHTFDANYQESNNQGGQGKTSYRDTWIGETLECRRTEVLTIACSQAYPQFNDGNVYIPVSAGGLVLGRTNVIEGWQDARALQPNPPLGDNEGWSRQSVSCAWDEVRIFSSCPGGYTLVSPGRNLRRHTVMSDESISVGEWRASSPLQCQQIITTVQQC